MNLRKVLTPTAFVMLAAFLSFSSLGMVSEVNAQIDKKDHDKTKGSKKAEKIMLNSAKATGTEDKNITEMRGKNSLNKPNVGSSKGRGQKTCHIDFDNRANLVIDIYVDGKFRGTLAEYGDAHLDVGSGATRIYARAEFDDGSALYWGPRDYTCGTNSKEGYVNFIMNR